MTYTRRIVVFLDILGFTNAVKTAEGAPARQEELYSLIQEIRQFFLRSDEEMSREQQFDIDTQVSQGSDSLVISINDNQSAGVYHLLRDCSFACHLLFKHGFLVRGYITIGNLIHDKGIIFGPSFIEAYKNETLEILPVIKFDYSVLSSVARTHPGNANIGFEETEISFINNHCKKLKGNIYYVDYFNDYADLAADSEEDLIMHYSLLKNLIQINLENCSNNAVLYKLLWARDRFNESKVVKSNLITPIQFKTDPVRFCLAFTSAKSKRFIKRMFI